MERPMLVFPTPGGPERHTILPVKSFNRQASDKISLLQEAHHMPIWENRWDGGLHRKQHLGLTKSLFQILQKNMPYQLSVQPAY